jgi:hypothetical protein
MARQAQPPQQAEVPMKKILALQKLATAKEECQVDSASSSLCSTGCLNG